MNLQNVKSTMVEKLLDLVAPHYCCSCGQIGSLLCEGCKYDITSEPFEGCLLCGGIMAGNSCATCQMVVEKTWCGGERSGALERLINRYKFEYAKAAHEPLGDIILAALPELPPSTAIVPIPTVRAHVRQRGYDHTLLIARYIAAKRGLKVYPVLRRRTNSVQRGANRATREAQAKVAYKVDGVVSAGVPYLLIDDVVTTGATLTHAAKALKDIGAVTIWAAAAARQPLD